MARWVNSMKRDADNSSFGLVTNNNFIIAVYFSPIYKSVVTNLTMVVLF